MDGEDESEENLKESTNKKDTYFYKGTAKVFWRKKEQKDLKILDNHEGNSE